MNFIVQMNNFPMGLKRSPQFCISTFTSEYVGFHYSCVQCFYSYADSEFLIDFNNVDFNLAVIPNWNSHIPHLSESTQ